ncbi:MAG: glycosyltransferase family 9 protein [Ktedonobacteraceae bacterium]
MTNIDRRVNAVNAVDDVQAPALTSVRRIAVFRALQLGDLLVAVPALRALRARFPHAEITLVGLPWARAFAQRFHLYIDRFVEFVGYPGIQELPVDAVRVSQFIAAQREYNYDLAIQMHGSGQSSNPFVHALGARLTVGYYEGTQPATLTLGAPYPHGQHEIYRNLGLVSLLCASEHADPRLEYPLFEEDHAEAAALLRTLPRADRPWVGIHPGARPPARRWPAEYFATVADTLARRFNAQIIVTGGPGEETIVQAVIDRMQTPALNLVGRTSLGSLAALMSKLDLFISNDTGPAHLAHAIERPSITIFGPADYQRWAPLNQTLHPAVRHPVSCSPCGHWTCPIDHRCLRRISPQQVLDVAYTFFYPAPLHVQSSPVQSSQSSQSSHEPDAE